MNTIATLRRLARAGIAACVAAMLATQAHADEPAPEWSVDQWNLLLANAWHTQGNRSFHFRQRWFESYEDARQTFESGRLYPPRHRDAQSTSTYARNLLEVEPALRFALARLNKGSLGPPLRNLNAAGEPNGWLVLELTDKGDLRKAHPDNNFKKEAREWIRRGWMAPPEVLEKDPVEQARRAYWPARTLDALAQVPASLSADVEYGDGSTPLTQALRQGDLPLARALFARGASVHRCGVGGCPLAAAVLSGKGDVLATVNWLLEQGARPDQRDPRSNRGADNPLAAAVLVDQRAVAERLLAAGAAVDGLPLDEFTPLEFAVLDDKRPWAEWLLAQDASPLPRGERPERNIVSEAALSKDTTLRAWAEAQLMAAAEQHPAYRAGIAVEQGGRRVLPNGKGLIVLKAAPFELVFELPAGARGVAVGASPDAAWLDEVRRKDRRNAMFNRFNAGALASADEPDSEYLLVDKACGMGVPADSNCGGGHMLLSTSAEPRRDFHAVRGDSARPLYVRRVQAVVPVATGTATPVQRLAGQVLHVALAIPVPLDVAAGANQLLPQQQALTLQFTK